MRLWGGTATHVGNVREVNQDRVYFRGSVAALADGMGGHQGGERAAELAIGEFRIVRAQLTQEELVDVVEEANRQVHHQAADPSLRGMGTTMVALGLHRDNTITVANVGDSRAYWLRGDFLAQITEDHSFVEDLVRQGRLSPEEATVHPQRNILTRALGIADEVLVDRFDIEPKIGDRFLLCSDGLFNEVSVDEITQILLDVEEPAKAASSLVAAALETPCRDNVTVAVVDVVDDDHPAVVDMTDMGIDLTPPEKITDQLPIVGRSVQITDRPEDGPSENGSNPHPPSLADEPAAVDDESSEPEADDTVELRGVVGSATDERTADEADEDGRSTSGPIIDEPVRLRDRSRILWRTLGLVAAVAMLVGGYIGLTRYNDSVFHVTVDDSGELVINRGRAGGLLWLDATEAERTERFFDDLTDASQTTVDSWGTFASLKDAQLAVDNLDIQEGEGGTPVDGTDQTGGSGSIEGATTGQDG
ncbi:MAG: protein phosphatase 2C domain-containing protein [Acidimicrobiia bacterium]|nr:protein phosphatase 2C domain-containing protein [Acidimicrobiia bacterium]